MFNFNFFKKIDFALDIKILSENCVNDKVLYYVLSSYLDKKIIHSIDKYLFEKYKIIYNDKIKNEISLILKK